MLAAQAHRTAELPITNLSTTLGTDIPGAKEYRHELLAEARGLRTLSNLITSRLEDLSKQLNPESDHERTEPDRSDGLGSRADV